MFCLVVELAPDGQLKALVRVPMLAKHLCEINPELKLHNRSSMPRSLLTDGNPYLGFIQNTFALLGQS